MPSRKNRLLLDSGVTVMWHLESEPYESQARELFLDGQSAAVAFACSGQMPIEIASAFLKALRRNRIVPEAARQAIAEILALPFTFFRATESIVLRALEIAEEHNQKLYDCVPVAMAERHRNEFWTGDERLYNALHAQFPFVRWIAHYQRKRPSS
jgi:predicted nucleic acid-binding protein